ncbi:hypothetical protein [Marinovum sp.]|uniref:hypothetical protein n=1 Tax=Marinovum sp. TaxID=2024839 RepID=UPI002B273937|nr:hypothetical protein [Marinovum sp.]
MGGIGSGRRWHFSAKDTTAGFRSVDVRRWAREGFLQPGNRFGWQWTADGEKVGSIRVAIENASLRLIYRTRSHSEDWQDMDYPVRLSRTPCNFGGERVWFHCPGRGCGRRVAILYGGSVFACRQCHDLAYPSQREDPLNRSMRRVEKLQARLDWDGGAFDGWGMRPKGMHRTTYERLLSEIRTENRAASTYMLLRFGDDATVAQLAEMLAEAD